MLRAVTDEFARSRVVLAVLLVALGVLVVEIALTRLLSFTLCVGVARGDDGPLSAAKQARVDEAERIEVQARDRLRAGDVDAAEAKALR